MHVDLDSVALNAEINRHQMVVNHCVIRNADKQLVFSGENIGDEIYFSCTSDLPPSLLNQFLDDYMELPGELSLPEQIDFKAKGVVDLSSDAPRTLKTLQLTLKADAWKWNDLVFDSLEVDGILDASHIQLNTCRVVRGKNDFNVFASGQLDGQCRLMGNPTVRLASFDKLLDLKDDDFFFQRFKYTGESEFDISYLATLDMGNLLETYHVDAILKARSTYYEGVLVQAAEAVVRVDPNIVTMTKARMQIDNAPYIAQKKLRNGVAASTLTANKVLLNFNNDSVSVEGLHTSAYPDYAMQMFSAVVVCFFLKSFIHFSCF